MDSTTTSPGAENAVALTTVDDCFERVRFRAMGASCEILFVAPDRRAARAFVAEAMAWLRAHEARYTRFRPDSLIARINAAAGRDWVTLDIEAERMFALADQVFVLTRGILDPSALPLVRLWSGVTAGQSGPSPEDVTAALSKVGWLRVRREPGRVYLPEDGMGLDFGCFAKEFAVDRMVEFARTHGIRQIVADFGSDLRVVGAPAGPSWTIGIENPVHPGEIIRRLRLVAGGVATAGDHRRYFECDGRRLEHVIDARIGYPAASGCSGVTVVAGSCLEAGLLATTAYVLGADEGLRLLEGYFGADGCIVTGENERHTSGFRRYVA